MTKPIIRIHDLEKDEVIDREMTDAEYDDYKELQIQAEAEKAASLEAEERKAAAQAKLAALGLTTDDLKALGL
jgi:hypothetical protein